MKRETVILSNSSSYAMDDSFKSTIWTPFENKLFENALAKFDRDTPDRWQRVAEMVPGKTVANVLRQYKELEDDVSSIEAGFYPKYGYNNNSSSNSNSNNNNNSGGCGFVLEWGKSNGVDWFAGKRCSGAGVGAAGRPVEQERKKGVPWTEEEHKLFLLGLKKYGKGDWRNISRNFVVTRTPTQVASHAQKYFIRQLSGGKDKRRASIHDITTVNINENHIALPENKKNPSPEQCKFRWSHANGVDFNQTHGNLFLGDGALHGMYGGPPSTAFDMHYPHG